MAWYVVKLKESFIFITQINIVISYQYFVLMITVNVKE